jgi:hypothetical protein
MSKKNVCAFCWFGVVNKLSVERGMSNIKRQIVPDHDQWVPVATAWRVVGLRMEERPPIWRVAANVLNKQSRTADKGRSSN